MAGSEIRYRVCCKASLIKEDKLTKSTPRILIKGSITFTLISAVSQAQTLASAALFPSSTISSIDELYQQFIKFFAATFKLLEQNQEFGPYK